MRFFLIYIFISCCFISCDIAHDKEIICDDNFKKARYFAYNNSGTKSALDSALLLINRCMNCDSIRKEVIDLKIAVLATMQNYSESKLFIDSLKSSDFTYPYKLTLNKGLFNALEFQSFGDTNKRNSTLAKTSLEIQSYIKSTELSSKEFKEVFTDLLSIKKWYMDSLKINHEVDSLILKYPEQAQFFNFFRK